MGRIPAVTLLFLYTVSAVNAQTWLNSYKIITYAFSIFIAHTLYSGILAYLSSAALVSQFAFPSGKWNGIQDSPWETLRPTLAVDSI